MSGFKYNALYQKELKTVAEWRASGYNIYMTSGGFATGPHIGHIRCIRETAKLAEENNGKVIVLVNSDSFILRKKGFLLMPQEDRVEIIAAIKGVDLATIWFDDTQTVSDGIELFKPDFFAKGGDRSTPNMIPELSVCEKIGTKILYGIGGTDKVESSTDLIYRIRNSKLW